MRILRALWSDRRFRVMIEAIVIAIAAYVTAVVTGTPVPTP